jgi:hypothetical protein
MMRTPTYCGWDEPSLRRKSTATGATQWKIAADDFRCLGNMPITSVHWWGSYKGWDGLEPPQTKPIAWRIGFWSNVPLGGDTNFSRPGKLLWQVEVPLGRVSEDWVGVDRYPQKPTDTCFQYSAQFKPEEYFWQSKYIDAVTGDLETEFWISIVAIYQPSSGNILEWGWKTRPCHWMDDAVSFELTQDDLSVGMVASSAIVHPIEGICGESYDMAFELDTDPNYIKWEQAFTGIRDWPHYEDEESVAIEHTKLSLIVNWEQQPDLTVNGVDVDATNDPSLLFGAPQILGDDYECTVSGPMTGFIDIWGSWYEDVLPGNNPGNVDFVLSFRADIPAGEGTTRHSMPGDVLWRKEFKHGQFTVGWGGASTEGYYSPCSGEYSPRNHKNVYEYTFPISMGLVQKGTPQKPIIYWLCVQANPIYTPETVGARFGWKTSVEHWNDDAVWAEAQEPFGGPWKELRYPANHPYAGQSIDLAFKIRTLSSTGLEYRRAVADDWRCDRRTPITALAWWGSYIGYDYQACQCQTSSISPMKPDYFLLSIWTDVPDPNVDNATDYSHPGQKIWEYKATKYDEVLVGYDKHPEYDSNTTPSVELGREPVFRYSVRLPKENWFCQKNVNDIYWLSIVAVYKDPKTISYPWGWTNHKCTSWEPAGMTEVLHWKLDETAGTIANDSSGNDNGGSLFGDAKWAQCCGRVCGALDLDGDGDYAKVDVPVGLNFAPGSFTTSAWVKARIVADGWKTIMEYDRDGWDRNRFGMWLNKDGKFHFRVGWDTCDSNQKLNANQWYLLTGTYNSTTKKFSLYVDGQFDTSADLKQGFTTANVAKLTVGVRGWEDGEYFDGLIDDVRIYDYALSASEVEALYAAGRNDDAVAGQMVIDPASSELVWIWEWEPLYDQTGMSEDMSFILFTEPGCLPCDYTTYWDWLTLGKPNCWCGIYGKPPWPYQCDGDADNLTEGTVTKYRVYAKDLSILVANWKKKIADPTLNPCADFDHKAEGVVTKYRVYTKDLAKIVENWKKKDAQLPGNCPRPE